jgi:hypothetical protein
MTARVVRQEQVVMVVVVGNMSGRTKTRGALGLQVHVIGVTPPPKFEVRLRFDRSSPGVIGPTFEWGHADIS